MIHISQAAISITLVQIPSFPAPRAHKSPIIAHQKHAGGGGGTRMSTELFIPLNARVLCKMMSLGQQ